MDGKTDADLSKPMLDLRFTHGQPYVRGDIVAITTWDRHSGEGVLVLLPNTRRVPASEIIPCVVQEKNAWKWSDTIGDKDYQQWVAAQFAAALRLPPAPCSIWRIMGIVRDLVGELATIPPMPLELETVVADLFYRDHDTGREVHQEVRDNV